MRIRLTKPHTHAGEPHQPGEVIDLPRAAAEFVLAAGSGEQVKSNRRGRGKSAAKAKERSDDPKDAEQDSGGDS